MGIAEVLGRFIGGLLDGEPADLEVVYQGELAGAGTKILTLCALKGLLSSTGHDGVSFVNALSWPKSTTSLFGKVPPWPRLTTSARDRALGRSQRLGHVDDHWLSGRDAHRERGWTRRGDRSRLVHAGRAQR